MTLSEMLLSAGLSGREAEAGALLSALPETAPEDWRRLASVLALRQGAGTAVLGIGGGQGAGKTTLARLTAQAFEATGRHAVCLSLDDFYLTRAERLALGAQVHPLLTTRGVPGTHAVDLAIAVIGDLKAGRGALSPVFDKAGDDRTAERRHIDPGAEVVIFEGWCVGAPAQPEDALLAPCNELEQVEDAGGSWRRYVNACLAADYQRLWRLMDELVFLKVPDIQAVLRWRTEQEQEHPPGRRMSAAALVRFVAHYERLTRWMGEILPETAELVGFLDGNHRLADLRVRR